MEKKLADEVKELNKRISELEEMLSILTQPLKEASKITSKYLKLTGLLLEHGGLTPDPILPEVKDPISKGIVRVLMNRIFHRSQNFLGANGGLLREELSEKG